MSEQNQNRSELRGLEGRSERRFLLVEAPAARGREKGPARVAWCTGEGRQRRRCLVEGGAQERCEARSLPWPQLRLRAMDMTLLVNLQDGEVADLDGLALGKEERRRSVRSASSSAGAATTTTGAGLSAGPGLRRSELQTCSCWAPRITSWMPACGSSSDWIV
jgi:hypothetical protein